MVAKRDSYGSFADDEEDFLLTDGVTDEEEKMAVKSRNRFWSILAMASLVTLGILGVSSGHIQMTSSNTAKPNSLAAELPPLPVLKTSSMKSSKYSFTASDVHENIKKKNMDKLAEYFLEFVAVEKKAYFGEIGKGEMKYRFEIWVNNVVKAHEKNVKGKNDRATYGVNEYSDQSSEERNKFLSFSKDVPEEVRQSKLGNPQKKDSKVAAFTATSGVVDWRGVYATPYIISQGMCGCCWAVSATNQMESDSIIAGISTIDDYFSIEQIVACDTIDLGCDGGNTEVAWYWMYMNKGTVKASSYGGGEILSSITTTANECLASDLDDSDYISKPVAYATLNGESQMRDYVGSTGPISICYAADDIVDYSSGVVTSCGTSVDHCGSIVGFNFDEDYWIVRNSWGSSWGEDGYFYLAYGDNLCDIEYDPHYLEVEAV